MIYFENAENLNDIFSAGYFSMIGLISVINLFFGVVLSKKFMQSAQQSGYVASEYSRWLFRRGNAQPVRLWMLALLSFLTFVAVSVAFSFLKNDVVIALTLLPYSVFVLLYYLSDKKRKEKKPFVLTKRALRLYITFSVTFFVLTFALLLGFNVLGYLVLSIPLLSRARFFVLCFTPVCVPAVVLFSIIFNAPFEQLINAKFVAEAKRTVEKEKAVIRIGITGSYGKTGVKDILRSILSEKYKVLATPFSYNTPMGICKTLKNLDAGYDVFIAEMGARRVGDIKKLCDIVRPSYGIINGIIEHHLETFKTLENVKKTKAELIEGVGDGAIVLTCDNPVTRSLAGEYKDKDIILAGVDTDAAPAVFASDIKLSELGSSFKLNVFGDEVEVSTSLIGKHNVSNICLAAALCYKIGMSVSEIAAGISRIKPLEHRLQVIKSDNGTTVIDDGYNSNVSGVNAAIEALSLFKGRKIIVTPGIVEMGKKERSANEEFGRTLTGAADIVILVGNYNSYTIRDAMIKNGYPLESVFIAKDLDDAKEKLKEISKEGDVILFENDLPDKFDYKK